VRQRIQYRLPRRANDCPLGTADVWTNDGPCQTAAATPKPITPLGSSGSITHLTTVRGETATATVNKVRRARGGSRIR
jgi:hypothetical protein